MTIATLRVHRINIRIIAGDHQWTWRIIITMYYNMYLQSTLQSTVQSWQSTWQSTWQPSVFPSHLDGRILQGKLGPVHIPVGPMVRMLHDALTVGHGEVRRETADSTALRKTWNWMTCTIWLYGDFLEFYGIRDVFLWLQNPVVLFSGWKATLTLNLQRV